MKPVQGLNMNLHSILGLEPERLAIEEMVNYFKCTKEGWWKENILRLRQAEIGEMFKVIVHDRTEENLVAFYQTLLQ